MLYVIFLADICRAIAVEVMQMTVLLNGSFLYSGDVRGERNPRQWKSEQYKRNRWYWPISEMTKYFHCLFFSYDFKFSLLQYNRGLDCSLRNSLIILLYMFQLSNYCCIHWNLFSRANYCWKAKKQTGPANNFARSFSLSNSVICTYLDPMLSQLNSWWSSLAMLKVGNSTVSSISGFCLSHSNLLGHCIVRGCHGRVGSSSRYSRSDSFVSGWYRLHTIWRAAICVRAASEGLWISVVNKKATSIIYIQGKCPAT